VKLSSSTFEIGVDVGGTHTDVVVATDAAITHGKALTTKEDLSNGVVDGLQVVAEDLGLSLEDLLTNCPRIVNGTTVVTNAVTELRGRPVGVLVTRGFRDTFRIARGARLNIFDDHQQTPAPTIVDWERTIEVTERIDQNGDVVAALDEGGVREAARRLVEEERVEAIAVVFLWSFKNGEHEARAREIVRELYPDLYVVASSDVHPLSREFERWNTALFTAFVRDDVVTYVKGLETKLESKGLPPKSLSLFQCLGGTLLPAEAAEQPLQLMDSGPVGGVIASRALAQELELPNVICADMGGTSFDVALLREGEFTHSKRRPLGHEALVTGLAAVDIVSIGAGGGSIAWTDRRGVPQVGPESAGSNPGPACYGRGGTRPTVTDAMIVMNFIDPADYLGGRRALDGDAARAVLSELGSGHDWSPEQAAAAVHDIAVTNMVNALREVSVHKGYDPRDFTMLAYGGMTPLFACTVAAEAGISEVVVPPHSAAFSAWGVVMADRVRRYARTVSWNLDDADQAQAVNAVAAELEQAAAADAEAAGLDPSALELRRVGAFRFLGQVWEIDLPLENRPLEPGDAAPLRDRFVETYEAVYGRGTAWKGSPVVMLDYEVLATISDERPKFRPWQAGVASPRPRGSRSIYDPGGRQRIEVDVYNDAAIGAGAEIEGPAIVDGGDTTIFVPPQATCGRAELGNLNLTLR
jgi:N-methylhydantoinase A